MIMSLSVKNQSIESSGITKDYKDALCEYIWNGFEAKATEVKISYTLNTLGGLDSVIVSDNGSGIPYDTLSDTFGAFLASQKNSLSLRLKSKANKGKGRFSFIAFSSMATWKTTYNDNGKLKTYDITLTDASKENIEYSEPVECVADASTGTTVTFFNIFGLNPDSFTLEAFEEFILTEFAWYLYLNKHKSVKLYINEDEIDYNKHINTEFSSSITKSLDSHSFDISLIVWKEKISEKFRCYYFDSNNFIKGIDTTTFNRNTLNFNHSVFVYSPFFNEWEKVSLFDTNIQIPLIEQSEDSEEKEKTLKKLKKEIQNFIEGKITKFMSGKADDEIHKMMHERKTFPKFTDDIYGEIRKKDFIRVTKELYCLEPRIFYKLKDVQEKSLLAFLNLLLSSEERENVLDIIEQIVILSTEQRQRFADILKKTKLENIIETISFIENRYRVIEILKEIIYDLSKYANEGDHIQTIIENNYWLFGEQYNLASADQTMYTALEQYNYLLYGMKNATEELPEEDAADRRMDIFMCSSRNIETSTGSFMEENIIVELKAPRVTLSKTVYRQIEDYMDFIRKKPQFNSSQRRWKFIAVCKEVDDDISSMYSTFSDRGKPGLVYQSGKYEIYALTWDDVFKAFELRHNYMLSKLKYNRDLIVAELKEKYPDENRDTVNLLTEVAVANL